MNFHSRFKIKNLIIDYKVEETNRILFFLFLILRAQWELEESFKKLTRALAFCNLAEIIIYYQQVTEINQYMHSFS
jgi:hypothetical protein